MTHKILSILMILAGAAGIYLAKTLLTLPEGAGFSAPNPWSIIVAAAGGGVFVGTGLSRLCRME